MTTGEFSFSLSTLFETFRENNFLIVHSSLVDTSELVDAKSIVNTERKGDFIIFLFEQISEIVKSISAKMVDDEICQEQLIPIITENSFDLILSVIGLWKIGAIPVPLNTQLQKKELLSQINFLKAQQLVCQKKYRSGFSGIKLFSFNASTSVNQKCRNDFSASDKAVVLFTSGTSGNPKAVELSFENLIAAFNSGNSVFHYSENNRWYLNLPLYHIGGFSILCRALFAGSSIVLTVSNELDSLKFNLPLVKPTIISLVPTQLKRICERKILPNKELRAALIGGGFSDDTILLTAAQLGWNIYKVYGSTETSAFATALQPEDNPLKINSAGKALENIEVKIFDENKTALPANETGEIAIKAASVFGGYLFNQEATNSVFYNDYYLTGDFGFLDSDGYLYLQNRRTDLIVSGGENISPVEIEQAISPFENIDEVCVIGVPDAEWGEIVVAIVSSKDEKEIDLSKLFFYLKDHLSSFKVPKKIIQVKTFPKTAIGKINRAEVKKMFYGV